MTNIRLDHFLTFTNAQNIDDYLKEYAGQGFIPAESTVRHDPGLRNGFVFMGPEYVEFCWVEDEAQFAAGDRYKAFRAGLRPFGIGMAAEDVHALHKDWTARGYSIPKVVSKAPRGASADAPALWSFQDIPGELLPGVESFALTYHARQKDAVKQVKIAPNTVYAIDGVTFVTTEPAARAASWRDLLAEDKPLIASEIGFDVQIGPHRAQWITPEAYQAGYGLVWQPSSHTCGDIALLHLLATDLGAAKTMLAGAGRRTFPICVRGADGLLVEADQRDGFAFLIREQPAETWLRERAAQTGEQLELTFSD
jgi:hypothetical protein